MSADENNPILDRSEMTGLDPERDRIIEMPATLVWRKYDDCGTSSDAHRR